MMKKNNPTKSRDLSGTQKKLTDATASAQAEESDENRNHNVKKTSLGPNTRR